MSKYAFGRARALVLAAALAATPVAHAFGPDDAGIFKIYDAKGKETDGAVRFYVAKDKWVAEERAKDGSWTPFACDTDCEILPATLADLNKKFGTALNLGSMSCLANGHFAVCSFAAGGSGRPRYMMIARTPKGPALIHLAQVERLS